MNLFHKHDFGLTNGPGGKIQWHRCPDDGMALDYDRSSLCKCSHTAVQHYCFHDACDQCFCKKFDGLYVEIKSYNADPEAPYANFEEWKDALIKTLRLMHEKDKSLAERIAKLEAERP